MSQEINENLNKALGFTHFLDTVFFKKETREKSSLQQYFQSDKTGQLLFDLSSIVVAPLYYQIKASEHLLEFMVEAFSGLVYWISQQDEQKDKAFENSIKFLGQFALRQSEVFASPFLNALSFICRALVEAYHFIKNLSITSMVDILKTVAFKAADKVNGNWEYISENLFNAGMGK